MSDLVSVILPNYNSAKFIEKTIESVQAQSHRNWELIVVDDKSTDDSPNIIKKMGELDSRIKFFQLDTNFGGPAKPRNHGMQKAQGNYIGFLDSDDLWHPDKIKIQLEVMNSNQLDFLATGLTRFFDESEIEYSKFNSTGVLLPLSYKKLIKKNIVPNSSVLVKKHVIDTYSFSEDKNHVAIEDYIGWLDLHQKNIKSAKLADKLLYYRMNEASISKSKFKMAKKIFKMLSEYREGDRPLKLKKYYYFTTYLMGALFSKIT